MDSSSHPIHYTLVEFNTFCEYKPYLYNVKRKRRVMIINEYDYRITVITTVGKKLTTTTKNTLFQFAIFQKYYGINSIVFTKSSTVMQFCEQYNITTIKEFKVNEYGMPILRGMIQQSRKIYPSDYVIYINSDILLNPNIFRVIYNTEQILGKTVLYAATVYEIDIPHLYSCTSTKCYFDSLSSFSLNKRRGNSATDVFVISNEYPIHQLQNAVVGRLRIDPLVLYTARQNKMAIVDVSTIPSFHQGFEDSKTKKKLLHFDDYYYNLRFIQFVEDGSLLANFRIFDYGF